MNKTTRQQLLLSVIKREVITSQEELLLGLQQKGAKTTQATLSRDICELGIIKKGGRYHCPKPHNTSLFFGHVQSLEPVTGSFLIVQTTSGLANGVAEWIDQQKLPEVMGTIAGDNTILIALKSSESSQNLIKKFSKLFSNTSSRSRRSRSSSI
ncbi:MAG TPA: hypothetical protein VJC18_04760, partial [bacterium]|nr:hypothetical protein [bacterium]